MNDDVELAKLVTPSVKLLISQDDPQATEQAKSEGEGRNADKQDGRVDECRKGDADNAKEYFDTYDDAPDRDRYTLETENPEANAPAPGLYRWFWSFFE